MNRQEWADFYRTIRQAQQRNRKSRRVTEFDHNGQPFKIITRPGHPNRILAQRIADRPTSQLIARELNEAAQDRRDAATGRWGAKTAKVAARMTIQQARSWRLDDWRAAARAA